jgi:hypothetical protein
LKAPCIGFIEVGNPTTSVNKDGLRHDFFP